MKNKEEIISQLMKTSKKTRVRNGFGWKGAAWRDATKEELIGALKAGKFAHFDVVETDDFFGIAFYSAADML